MISFPIDVLSILNEPKIIFIDYSGSVRTFADNMFVNDEIDLYGAARVYAENPDSETGRKRIHEDYELAFSSDKPDVVSVDENGNLKALSVGSAKITVSSKSYPDVKAVIDARVITPVTGVALTAENDSVQRVSKTKFTATVEPATNINQLVNWSVYAKRGTGDFALVTDGLAGVTTVSTSGAVTVGELTVNATAEDIENGLDLRVRATSASNYSDGSRIDNPVNEEIFAEKTVSVTGNTAAVTGVSLKPVASTVEAYSDTLIRATVKPTGDDVDKRLNWTVTDTSGKDLLSDPANGIDLAVMPDFQSAELQVNLLGRNNPYSKVIVKATSVSDPAVIGKTEITINPEKMPTALSFTPAATETCYADEVSLTLKPDVIGAYPGVNVSVWKGDQKVTESDGIKVTVSEISTSSGIKITDPKRSTAKITFKTYRYIADEGEQEYTIKAESTTYKKDEQPLSAEAKITVKNRYELFDTPGFTLDAGDTKTLKIYDNKQKKYVNATSWESSDPQVASVSSTGLVKALKGGMAVIQPMMGDDELATECYTPINTTVTVNGTLAMPVATVIGGKSTLSLNDQIVLTAEEGTIRYIVNPVYDPSAEPQLYSGPINVTEQMLAHTTPDGRIEILAWAEKDGLSSEQKNFSFATEEKIPEDDWGDVLNEEDRARYGNQAKNVPDKLWMSTVEAYDYTGSAIKPEIRVYDHKKLLTSGTDYTITYKNNTKAYTASTGDTKSPAVTVTFKNNYSGTLTQVFTINAVSLAVSNTDVIIPDQDGQFNGTVQKIIPPVTWNGKALKNKTDFEVTYPNSDPADPGYDAEAYQKAGDWKIRITGKNNFKESREITFTIHEFISMSSCKVSAIKQVTYTGSAFTPDPEVKYGSEKLVKDQDYTLSYAGNINAGQATVTITAKEGSKYYGSVSKHFTIKPASIAGATVTIKNLPAGGKYVYENTAVEPVLTVTLKDRVTVLDPADYVPVYSKNKTAGTATAKTVAKGNYTGSASVKFKIDAFDFEEDAKKPAAYRRVEFNYLNTVSYNPAGAHPEVVLLFDGNELYEGKDYTVKFSNNKAVGRADDPDPKKRPTITITGKGGFKGKLTASYTIDKTNIDFATMYVNDVVFKDKKGNYKTKVKLVDANGKALSAGKDYDKELFYFYHETGAGHLAGEAVGKNDVVPAGTTLRVKVLGMKNYKGAKTCLFRVGKTSLSGAKCKIADQNYTGKSIYLNGEDLKDLKIGNTLLKIDVDYEIIGYEKNINAGTATVIIRGKGDYVGDKKLTFKIVKKPAPKP